MPFIRICMKTFSQLGTAWRRRYLAGEAEQLENLGKLALVVARVNDLEMKPTELVNDVVNASPEFGAGVQPSWVDVRQVIEFERRVGV